MNVTPEPIVPTRPIQGFEDNLRPAKLMIDMYRLLDCADEIQTDGDFVDRLRDLVKAAATEDLMVVQNELFVGLVREKSGLPITSADAQIAAICRSYGATLATRNVADFAHTGVEIVNPWQAATA